MICFEMSLLNNGFTTECYTFDSTFDCVGGKTFFSFVYYTRDEVDKCDASYNYSNTNTTTNIIT